MANNGTYSNPCTQVGAQNYMQDFASVSQINFQGHPTTIFGKCLFRRRFEIQNFRNIFFVVKFLACLPLLGFSNPPPKKWYNCPFLMYFYPKKVTYNFREPFSRLKFSKKVSFDPYNFWITRLSGRKSEQMKYFQGIKICLYLPFKY